MRHNDRNDLIIRDFDEGLGLFDNIFDDFFRPTFPVLRKEFKNFDRTMRTDIKENDNTYELSIEMPGFSKDDITLDLNNGYLTISAEKSDSNDEKDKLGNYIRRERSFGKIARSFYVGDLKEENINAKLNAGVLNISIPKSKPQVEAKKKIEIK